MRLSIECPSCGNVLHVVDWTNSPHVKRVVGEIRAARARAEAAALEDAKQLLERGATARDIARAVLGKPAPNEEALVLEIIAREQAARAARHPSVYHCRCGAVVDELPDASKPFGRRFERRSVPSAAPDTTHEHEGRKP